MTEKLDVYDILGILVPGTLIVYLVGTLFPKIASHAVSAHFPSGFELIAFIALALFAGNLVQAIASLIEPLLDWTWGGRPSERALRTGLGERYLPADSAKRIRHKLQTVMGADATERSLFLVAMQRAAGARATRVSLFNGLYAYHRGLLVVVILAMLLFVAATPYGIASAWSWQTDVLVLVGGAVLLFLIWYRTKQRAFYYVREVLLAAEHATTDGPAASSTTANTSEE